MHPRPRMHPGCCSTGPERMVIREHHPLCTRLCSFTGVDHGGPRCARALDYQFAQQQAGAAVGMEGVVPIRVAWVQDGEAQQVQVAARGGRGR